MTGLSRPKVWVHPVVVSEHVFDKLWGLDLTLGEFRILLDGDAEVIEEVPLGEGELKDWCST